MTSSTFNNSTNTEQQSLINSSMYATTYADYGKDYDLTKSPNVHDVLELVPRMKRPINFKNKIDLSDYPTLNSIEKAKESRKLSGNRLVCAHVSPVQFPVQNADDIKYPDVAMKGARDLMKPQWQLTSYNIGEDKPKQHQLPEKFYPKSNDFTNTFTQHLGLAGNTSSYQNTKLKTTLARSRVHGLLDETY